MKRSIQITGILLALLIAFPAFAAAKTVDRVSALEEANPDGYTNITFTAGLGDFDGITPGGADVTVYGVELVYPVAHNFSLLGKWNHSEMEWNGPAFADWDTNLYTVGFRLYLGN